MTHYTDLTIDQLRSAILQRDEQLRVALAEVEEWKQSTTAVALASQEVEKDLKNELLECTRKFNDAESDSKKSMEVAGRAVIELEDVQSILNHHKTLLEECRVALESVMWWRNGAEGPDVLFADGSTMIKKVNTTLVHLKALDLGVCRVVAKIEELEKL